MKSVNSNHFLIFNVGWIHVWYICAPGALPPDLLVVLLGILHRSSLHLLPPHRPPQGWKPQAVRAPQGGSIQDCHLSIWRIKTQFICFRCAWWPAWLIQRQRSWASIKFLALHRSIRRDISLKSFSWEWFNEDYNIFPIYSINRTTTGQIFWSDSMELLLISSTQLSLSGEGFS